MKNKHDTARSALMIIVCILIIGSTSVLFISQMNGMVQNNIMNTISELAEHDLVSIQNFVETEWNDLYNIHKCLEVYDCDTILEIQERMNLERATSDFHTIYLVAEDGTVYTDRYMVYPKEKMDIYKYLEGSDKRIVKRYDFSTATETQKEMLLYAIRLEDYIIEDTRFTALVGVSNIKQIQEKMALYSFDRNGRKRGYSSVINPNGDYIVDVKRTASLNQRQNMYEMLLGGKIEPDWSNDIIRQKIEREESFYFYYTDEEEVERLFYLRPVEETNWHFLLMVETEVFTEQSRMFIFSSIAMLVTAVFVSVSMLLLVMRSHSRELKANAEVKARSEFLSNMSHEIRTPLNGIIGLLYLMRRHVQERKNAQMLDWIDKADTTSKYLLSLVNDILDMSKIQAGKVELVEKPFMLEDMIDAVCSVQRSNIEANGVEFIVEKDITVPCIIGDETRIKQVLMNIVGNAAKFTPRGGTIKVSASQGKAQNGSVRTVISCEDTGIGMSQQFLKKIWDSFAQEHNKESDATKGTGLGMAISKRLMDAMGGELTVKSQVDLGSTFDIILNLKIAERSLPISEDKNAWTDSRLPRKILIAEDNELNAELLTGILEAAGFETVVAKDGQAAVDQFMQSEPGGFDIILMDMQMPVMDGCKAAETIRGLDRADAKTILIFACTANAFQEDRDKAMNSGMNDFLTKPIDIHILLEKLNNEKSGERQ